MRDKKEEGVKEADPGLQSIMSLLKVTTSASWLWELKRRGILGMCEMRATVEPG